MRCRPCPMLATRTAPLRVAAPIRSRHSSHAIRSPKIRTASAMDQSLETLHYRLELASAYEPWLECVEELKLAGLNQEASERAVSKAYGWTYSAYWRGEKAEATPELESMQDSLLVLQDLGLTEAELIALLKTFPEALACHPEDQLQKNLTKLREEYKLNGKFLVKALGRQPRILGYTFSCEGDCAGECHKCWARF